MSVVTPEPQHTLLAPDAYYDSTVYQREMQQVFASSWLHVGHASRLPAAGDYLTTRVADQAIIVIRGEDGDIRAFHNVCRHRGSELLQGTGHLTAIVCPYHGWTYRTDGSLRYARGTEAVPGFDPNAIRLSALRFDSIAGFLFVNLDPQAEPLSRVYRGLEAELRHFEPDLDRLVHVRSTSFDLAVNWKVAVENYLEAYHLVCVHPALRNSVDNDNWEMTLHPRYTSLIGNANPSGESGDIAYDFTAAEKLGQTNWWLWPMMMFEQMPGGSQMFTYNHLPLGPERTLQVVDFYFLDTSMTDERKAEIDYIEKVVRLEDKVTIEGVQRGLHSPGYRSGPLMIGPGVPEEITEKGILHFQQMVRGALA